MRTINKRFLYIALTFILCLIAVLCSRCLTFAYAATYSNTDVLNDLQKDSSFNAADYPKKVRDYSIKVIQVAEGADDNLYLYTYQPCQNTKSLVATDINMSLNSTVDGTKLYSLTLINTNDVFAKYLVNDVKVNSEATRYYNISSIYRVWDEVIDGETGTNNKGEKKAYPVQSIYKVTTENGEKKYQCEPTYVVNILNPYADFLLYTESQSLPAIPSIKYSFETLGFIDAHYIAFSTDLEIDRLLSATVTYVSCSASGTAGKFLFFPAKSETTYGKEESGYAEPTYSDKGDVVGASWTGRKYRYSWDRIQTVAEFISTEPKLTDETKSNLQGKQWILRFTETKRTQTERTVLGYHEYQVDWTEIKKVSVLRLEFETDGKVYNLGAVSDAVSDDGHPGNVLPKEEEENWFDKIINFFKKASKLSLTQWIFIILGVIIGIGLIVALIIAIIKFGIKAVVKAIGWLIVKLFKAMWWIICLPFRGLKALFTKPDDEDKGN